MKADFLPAGNATMAARGNPDTEAPAPSRPLVIAVDDDPSILRVMKILLEGNGFELRTAATGEEALPILRQSVPVVLILDVELPGMSGFDVCQIVKRDARLQKVPVLLLTAHGSPKDYRTGHEAGAVAYMFKPYKAEQLLQMVRMLAASPAAGA